MWNSYRPIYKGRTDDVSVLGPPLNVAGSIDLSLRVVAHNK
jgi:hypothetical protein